MLSRRSFHILALLALLPPALAAVTDGAPARVDIRPQIPTADRSSGNRVFLERANELRKETNDSFMILVGDVVFTKGPMIMKCDSAHYFPDSESMNAYGNVSMEQGDTLFVYADELDYNGPRELATLYADPGKKVRLINRDVMLETDVFVYDLAIDLGYYDVGGVLTDPQNRLVSEKGEYVPSTKEANFYDNVHLNSRDSKDTLDIYTDTLYYNTGTHVAQLFSPSEVINARGTIYTTAGTYETDSSRAILYDRSTVVTSQGQTLTADTIYYDRNAGFGEAWGNMVMTDSAHQVEIRGQYGFYDELKDSSFVTGRALLTEYRGEDTLYMHARYIQSWSYLDTVEIKADSVAGIVAGIRIDTTHVAVAFPRVRFYRRDMQGICDSMRFTQKDTMLRMFINPVVWSDNQQIFGNIIEVHLNDSTIERAQLPDNGFAAQQIEGEHFNQISGKQMTAYFEGGELRKLDISGNVEIIMYPEENDSTVNKMVSAESSFLTALFRNQNTEFVKMWPQTTGTATPLFLARRSMYYLPKFKWFGDMRPLGKDDVFVVPVSMESMMQESGRTNVVMEFTPRIARLEIPPEDLPEIPASDSGAGSTVQADKLDKKEN